MWSSAACSGAEQRQVASFDFGRAMVSSRAPSGARHESRQLVGRFGARHREASVERAVVASWWVCVAEQTGFVRSTRRRSRARSSDGELDGRRDLRVANSGVWQTTEQSGEFHAWLCVRERRDGSLHRVGCESRRPRSGTARVEHARLRSRGPSSKVCTPGVTRAGGFAGTARHTRRGLRFVERSRARLRQLGRLRSYTLMEWVLRASRWLRLPGATEQTRFARRDFGDAG
jgi:hypothetical protein